MEAAIATPPVLGHPFPKAFIAGDREGMRRAMAPDVVLNSPILSTPFQGRETLMELFDVILETLEDIRYTAYVAEGDLHFMSFTTRVGKVEMQGVDILHLDEEGRVKEFTVFFRPLTGITVLARALGKGLAGRRSRARGVLAGAGIAPMVAMARASDRIAPKLVK